MLMERFEAMNGEALVIRFERGQSVVYRLEERRPDTMLFAGHVEKCYDFCKEYLADIAEGLL